MNPEFTAFAENAAIVAAEMASTFAVEVMQADGTYQPEQDAHASYEGAYDEYVDSRENGIGAIIWEVFCDGQRDDIRSRVDADVLKACYVNDWDVPDWVEGSEIANAESAAFAREDADHVRSERSQMEVV